MKNLKTKLMTSLIMLVIAAVLMATSSYAWFTISTNPEISNITANVTANGNLEIALAKDDTNEPDASAVGDAGKNETWGNLIDLKDFFVGNSGKTVTLKPVQFLSTAEGAVTIKKPVYGLDGRIKSLDTLTRIQAKDLNSNNVSDSNKFVDYGGVWVYRDATVAATTAGAGAAGTYDAGIYAFEVDYWLRTNATGSTVSLTTAVSRAEDASDANAGETGLGSFITDEKNVTILIQDGTKWYLAQRSAASGGKYPLTLASCTINATTGIITVDEEPTNSIALVKDTAKKLKMFVFMDGTALTNADALLAITEFTMNIQFTSSEQLISEDVGMSEFGRKTASSN